MKKTSLFKLFVLFAVLMTCINTAWGANTPAAAGTYTLNASNKPNNENKFYKLGNGVYIHRRNNSSQVNDGLKVISSNTNGIAVYVNSSMNLSCSIYKASSRKAQTVGINVYTLSNGSTTFDSFESGTDNTTTVSVTLSASATYTTSVSFAATESNTTETKSSSNITLAAGYYYIVPAETTSEGKTFLQSITLAAASSCSAPSSVTVTGTNKYLGGQTISLTATPTGGSGTATYQWQKKISGVWTDIDNGDDGNGATIAGATTNNLTISTCGHNNSGGYRCIVSTGDDCDTKSCADGESGYGVHVYSIYGRYYNEGEWVQNEIAWTSGTTGTATIHLKAKKTYTFKVRSNNDLYYGSGAGNYIITKGDSKDCGTGNQDVRLFTGPEGDYTFTVDIEHGLDNTPYVNVVTNYPTVSHPDTGYVYVQKFSWTPYLHYWYDNDHVLSSWGSDPQLNSSQYTTICGTEYWYVPVIDYYCNFIAKNAAGDSGESTGDQHTNSPYPGQRLYNDGSWKWDSFSTYTISFANGGGSGSMADIAGICPNSSQEITSNAFEKTGYTFNCWHADKAVKVGGSTIPAGGDIAGGATLQEINNDITLTAQWIVKTTTITLDKNNSDPGSTSGSATVTYGSDELATYTAATRTGYTLDSYKTETSGGSLIIKGNGSLNSGDKGDILAAGHWSYDGTALTLYAQWEANKYNVTHTLSHVTRSSGGQAGENKATYGTEYSVVFAADGGYTLPAAVSVTVGESDVTANCTWNQSTGALTIPVAYVTGNIVITVTGVAEPCTPINASVVFDNNKSTKYNTSWVDGDVATSGSASCAKNSIGSDTGHPMTKPAMKLDNTGDYIKITLPSGVATGTITVLACTYSGKTGTLIINDENNSDTPLTSAEVGLNGGTQTYKINSPDGGSWTAPTLKTVSYNITSGGDYYIKQSAGNSIYVFAFSATGVKECPCEDPDAPTEFTAGSITSTGVTFSITDAGDAASYDIYYSTSSDAPTAGTAATTTSNSKTKAITGLTASTTYYAWVRSVCNSDHKSAWVALGGSSFTTIAPPTYSITYNCDDATSGCPSDVAAATNLPDPLPSGLTKTGYVFGGWYTNSAKTDAAVAGAALTGNTTLYAKWTRDIKTAKWGLTFNDFPSETSDTRENITITTTKTSSQDGSGKVFSGNQYYNFGDGEYIDINLASGYYLTDITYSAHYDPWRPKGGTCAEEDGCLDVDTKLYIDFSSSSTFSTSTVLNATPIELTGNEWGDISTKNSVASIPSGAQSARIFADGSYEFGGDLFYLAVERTAWDCTPSTVSFNAGGASGTVPASRLACGETTLPGPGSLTKSGYRFDGWNDGTSTYYAGDTYDVTENVTFTAQWRDPETPLIIPTVTHLDATNYHAATAFVNYNVDGNGSIKCVDISGKASVDWKFKITPGYYTLGIAYGAPDGYSTDITVDIYDVDNLVTPAKPITREVVTTSSATARCHKFCEIFDLTGLSADKTYKIVVTDTYSNKTSHACIGYIDFTKLTPLTITDDITLDYRNVTLNPGTVSFDVKNDGNEVTCLDIAGNKKAEWLAYITPNYHTIEMLYGTPAYSTNVTFSIIDPATGSAVYAPSALVNTRGDEPWSEEKSWSDVDMRAYTTDKPYIIRVADTYGDNTSHPKVAKIDFIPTKYELAWSSNGGNALTGDYTSGDVAAGVAITAPDTPTRTGYDFVKWNSADDGTGDDLGAKMPMKDVTYYAQWAIQTFTITWQNYDGTTLETDEDVEYGETPSYDGSTPTKASTAEYTYTFDTWDPSVSSVTGDATYTAAYTQTANNYTLTWDLAGGTVTTAGTGAAVDATGTPYSSVAYGSEITAPIVTKSGYDFAGWNVTPASTMPAANTTYTAQWADLYRVDYNAMTGSVDPSYATGSMSSKVTLPEPTKSGYDFLGWYNTAGTRVGGAGDKYGPTEAVTLYAKWQGSCSGTGTTIYKARIKTSGMSSLKSEIEALSTNTTLTTDNYLSELSGGTLTLALTAAKASVPNDSTISFADNEKAYLIGTLGGSAKFQAGDIITIGVYNQSGYIQKTSGSYSALTDIPVDKRTTRISFVVPTSLIGENTFYIKGKSNGMYFAYVDVYRPGEVLFFAEVDEISTETDLGTSETEQTTSTYLESISGGKLYTKGSAANYAKVVTSHEISLTQANDGTYIKLTLDKKLAAGDKIIINTSIQDKPFGITTSATHSTTITVPYTIPAESGLKDQQTIYLWRNSSTSNLRSIAIIRPNVSCHTVTYDGNGATSGYVNDPAQYTSGTSVMVSSGTYTKTNYIFNGWNTAADGSGTDYDYYGSNDHFTITGNTTLYAQWKIRLTSDNKDFEGYDAPTYNDVEIASGKTLTITQNTTVRNITVETGATLNIATTDGGDGVTFTAKSLHLKGGWNETMTKYDMPRVFINSKSTLTKSEDVVNFDIAVTNQYSPFAVPFKVKVSDVDYAKENLASASTYLKHYFIRTYDGENRAKNGPNSENWTTVPLQVKVDEKMVDNYLEPGRGYALAAKRGKGDLLAIVRLPMTVDDDWTAAGEKETINEEYYKNQVVVTAWEKDGGATTPKKDKGWNILGVPYMSCFVSSEMASDQSDAYLKGLLNITTGEYTEDGNVYVTVPKHDFSEYDQLNFSEAKLLPGWCFFVQMDKDATLTFDKDGERASAPFRAMTYEHMPTVKTGIILSRETASDKTTFLISDKYSAAEYEINADLEKMFGENSYTLATYSLSNETRLAYNAMSRADAANVIPIGYRAPAEGEYTFAVNPRYAESGDFERIDLIDYETGFVTNLLQSSYTFTSDRTQSDSRFALNVVPQKETPTDVEPVTGDGLPVTGARKVIIDNKIYIIRGGRMYDATGRMVK